jgi:hypothetical protein
MMLLDAYLYNGMEMVDSNQHIDKRNSSNQSHCIDYEGIRHKHEYYYSKFEGFLDLDNVDRVAK